MRRIRHTDFAGFATGWSHAPGWVSLPVYEGWATHTAMVASHATSRNIFVRQRPPGSTVTGSTNANRLTQVTDGDHPNTRLLAPHAGVNAPFATDTPPSRSLADGDQSLSNRLLFTDTDSPEAKAPGRLHLTLNQFKLLDESIYQTKRPTIPADIKETKIPESNM